MLKMRRATELILFPVGETVRGADEGVAAGCNQSPASLAAGLSAIPPA